MSSCGKHMKKRGRISKKHIKKGGMLRVIAKGGSLASDMVMANVNGKATPGQYPPGKKITTVHPYGNTCLYQTTGGGVYIDLLKDKNKKEIIDIYEQSPQKKKFIQSVLTDYYNLKTMEEKDSSIGVIFALMEKIKEHYPDEVHKSINELAKSVMKQKGGKKSKKAKKAKKTKKGRKQRGGSDWIASQYSLDVGQNKDVNPAIFSKSKPASMNKLLNPPNMGSAGSGYC